MAMGLVMAEEEAEEVVEEDEVVIEVEEEVEEEDEEAGVVVVIEAKAGIDYKTCIVNSSRYDVLASFDRRPS